MQDPYPNVTSPPDKPDAELRRLYEEPRSTRERHYGLMQREPDEERTNAG